MGGYDGAGTLMGIGWPADWPDDETWKPPVCDWNSFPAEVRQRVEEKLKRLGS